MSISPDQHHHSKDSQKINVGIVGGTGYTGVELVRLLVRHPAVHIAALTSRTEAGTRVDAMFPSLRGLTDLKFTNNDANELANCQVVFFATPHGVAMKQARELVENGTKVIDLAADFRLQDTAEFEKWYGMPHSCPDLLAESVYGLPEINRAKIQAARIIGNPGCYPTTVQLGLLPLLEQQAPLIDPASLIIDAKSGVSGAGRKAEVSLLFSEASDSFKAYAVKGHRHHPEIAQGLKAMQSDTTHHQVFDKLTFVPHLVPMIRGMFSTIYVRLTEAGLATDLQSLFEKRYADEPFVDVMPAGSLPDTRSVRGSNHLRIALHRPNNGDLLVILVVQDNLVKGAAGQAVQNMNLMFGLPETLGLDVVPLMP
ncbi:N-acetyl-gamma-glutamyl-phosphate reductase [Aquirhabdus parva]|uniref:N-acetyl-gamma-glutamyl-phosphate reductase n=1 Tax=Aquirhabdus parva TaxID=2283318 RepID=A0A345P4A5_9GAMM|nr:N-acetyl-gamma-glutamyl-phosphate reductase [Aquirhabdus parva]AXI02114.1 N-acetyl-gamma-glutamyl-phosphate reductase [Aquirhabdus parva]